MLYIILFRICYIYIISYIILCIMLYIMFCSTLYYIFYILYYILYYVIYSMLYIIQVYLMCSFSHELLRADYVVNDILSYTLNKSNMLPAISIRLNREIKQDIGAS